MTWSLCVFFSLSLTSAPGKELCQDSPQMQKKGRGGQIRRCNGFSLLGISGRGVNPLVPTPHNLSTILFPWGLPDGSAGKESPCNAGNLGLIPGLERAPGEGKGCPLLYSGLENPMDSMVHAVTKSQTRLSDFHFISLGLPRWLS